MVGGNWRAAKERGNPSPIPCHKARQATAEAGRIHPDVILMDVRMPKMSGYDVFEKLLKDPSTSKIPVVLMTAKTITLNMPAYFLHELGGIVNKPFSKQQLIHGLRAAMEKRRNTPGG